MTQHVRDALDDQGRPPAHLRCLRCNGRGAVRRTVGLTAKCPVCDGTGLLLRPATAPLAGAGISDDLADAQPIERRPAPRNRKATP